MSIDDRLPAEPDVGASAGHDGAPSPSRRGFIKAVGIGGVLAAGSGSLLPLLGDVAGAQSDDGAASGDGPSSEVALEVATTLEFAASQLYEEALEGGTLDDETTEAIREFGPNHQVHGDQLAAARAAISTDEAFDATALEVPNQRLYSEYHDRITGASGKEALLPILIELEATLAATLLEIFTNLDDPTDAKIVASVQMVDAQQEVVLSQLLDQPIAQTTPATEPTDGALDVEAYQ